MPYLTERIKRAARERILSSDYTQEDVARALGKSTGWVTSFLKPLDQGGLKSIKEADLEVLEDFLGVSLIIDDVVWSQFSPKVSDFAKLAEQSSEIYALVEAILRYRESSTTINSSGLSDLGRRLYSKFEAFQTDSQQNEGQVLNFESLARSVVRELGFCIRED